MLSLNLTRLMDQALKGDITALKFLLAQPNEPSQDSERQEKEVLPGSLDRNLAWRREGIKTRPGAALPVSYGREQGKMEIEISGTLELFRCHLSSSSLLLLLMSALYKSL